VPSNAPVARAILALADGIGQTLYESIRSFHYGDAPAQIIIVVTTVIAVDLISARIRKALI
jgi:phosphonate transport system permease protein